MEIFLECGANVNALHVENNTALHLCTHENAYFGPNLKNKREDIINLILLRYSAHVDLVNNTGDLAAKGLMLNMSDYINLQCIKAMFIRDHRIPYVGIISAK